VKPVFIERIQTEFLLCYSDYSFFVNRNGWRARPDWIIAWEGNPNAFAIFNPYILAFEPSFIEIRHMDTGMLVHIITAKNVRMLHSSTREVCFTLLSFRNELWTDLSFRFSMPTKMKWAKTLSPLSTSGAMALSNPHIVIRLQQWPRSQTAHNPPHDPHNYHTYTFTQPSL